MGRALHECQSHRLRQILWQSQGVHRLYQKRSPWRRNSPNFQEPELSINLEMVGKMEEIAKASGHNMAQLALAWVLRDPVVTGAIAGARTPAQIEQTVEAGNWNLSSSELEQMAALLAERDEKLA